ncbi:MAG TPA: hypothetical protein VJ302_21465 [Blastocatellia bacterium]|nr:hypothetical protein [Blastocatellia bacterium]
MIVTLVDIEQAADRLAAGEPAYEFQTGDPAIRILGPACGFGLDHLKHLRKEGFYAESFEEATEMARAKATTVTGIWFVKR